MMFKLPWIKDDPLDGEVNRQLALMEKSDTNSPEYKFAFQNLKELYELKQADQKLAERKRSRWFDGGLTLGICILTLTQEMWTPMTSRWTSTFMRVFKHRDGEL